MTAFVSYKNSLLCYSYLVIIGENRKKRTRKPSVKYINKGEFYADRKGTKEISQRI
jgi:hypothetical protein